MIQRAMMAAALVVIASATVARSAAELESAVGTGVIQVTGGVADFQLLPRGAGDRAAARLRGRCYPREGVIEARLCDRGAPVADLDWRAVGQASGGTWTGELRDLPTGGPYDIEVRLTVEGRPLAADAVRGVLVGDLWILAGQSNMQGVGRIAELPPPMPTVTMFTVDDRWQLAQEPLHPLLEAADEVHWKALVPAGGSREDLLAQAQRAARAREAQGAGPGLPFAWELYRLTGVPVGLIPCAHGGSSLAQWSPARRPEGGRSLYGAMIRRAAAAGGKIRGLLWYQGESDALGEAARTYQRRFLDFAAAVRRDLDDPDLCLLYVQIGRFVNPPDGVAEGWDTVREAQRLAEAELQPAAVVPAIDATLADLIHLDTAGQMKVGRRLALQAAREVHGRRDLRRGPRLARVALGANRTLVSVRFSDVNGRLRADGRPGGFSLDDPSGRPLALITRIDLPADRPDTVELHLSQPLPEGARLWYGRGLDPLSTLTDEQDLGMLAFGPVAIPYPRQR